jgi:O-antigen/teichoic acid export membrane protein
MTIREYLQRRQLFVKIGLWLVAVLVFLWMAHFASRSLGAYSAAAWLTAFGLLAALVVGATFTIRCPRCGRHIPVKDRSEKCRHCGVSFDEPCR